MNVRVKASEGIAVDHDYLYRPIETCPRGVKVLLLTVGEVAVIGVYDGNPKHYIGWVPLPKIRKERTVSPPGFDDGLGF